MSVPPCAISQSTTSPTTARTIARATSVGSAFGRGELGEPARHLVHQAPVALLGGVGDGRVGRVPGVGEVVGTGGDPRRPAVPGSAERLSRTDLADVVHRGAEGGAATVRAGEQRRPRAGERHRPRIGRAPVPGADEGAPAQDTGQPVQLARGPDLPPRPQREKIFASITSLA